MATLVLSTVGGAVGGPVGAFIGSTIGGYIDSNYLGPALFPQPDIDGPRLDDLRITNASDGTPAMFAIGPEAFCGGAVTWASELIETVTEEEVGGKGGGGNVMTSYSYSAHVMVSVCRNEINAIKKVWVEGKVFYDGEPDVDVSTLADGAGHMAVLSVTQLQNSSTPLFAVYASVLQVIESTDPDVDLSQFASGTSVTVGGYTASGGANNGTFPCWYSFRDQATGNSSVTLLNPNAVAETPSTMITLDQSLPEFSVATVTDIDFYFGTSTQTADPLIEAIQGSGNVPGYRDRAYVVFTGLQLAQFGNRIPQSWEFLVEETAGTMTLATGFDKILARSELDSSEYDTSGIDSLTNLTGYTVRGPQPIAQQLAPLMLVFNVIAQERDGVIHFFSRDVADTTVVDPDDQAAHEIGSDTPRSVDTNDLNTVELPRSVQLTHIDPARDYQNSTQIENRVNATTGQTQQYRVDITMTGSSARCAARRLLWLNVLNNRTIRVQLPPSYLATQENDNLTVTLDDGETETFLCRKFERGNNGLLLYEGVVDESQAFDFQEADCPAEAFSFVSQPIAYPPEGLIFVIDSAAFTEEQAQTPGFYVSACLVSPSAFYAGGSIYQSFDGGTTFSTLGAFPTEGTVGGATTILGDGRVSTWDLENTVTVELFNGTIESKTDAEVFNGLNWAMLGTEVIAYGSATLTGTNQGKNVYVLSRLLRGLQGTESETGGHAIGDQFIALSKPGVKFFSMSTASINATREFKFVPDGGVVDDYTAIGVQLKAKNIQALPPGPITSTRDSSDDITVDVFRRPRAPIDIFSTMNALLLETTERFSIDVYDHPKSSIVATYDSTVDTGMFSGGGSSPTTFSYTAAQQTTDGLTAGNPVNLEIFQVTGTLGRGQARTYTVS